MKHFTLALQRYEVDHYKALFGGLAEMQMDLLYVLAWLSEFDGVTAASTNQVYEEYQELVEGKGPSYRRVAGVLKEMEVTNLIGGRTVSRGRGGRSSEVWLKIPAQNILDYLKPDWKQLKERKLKLDRLKKRMKMT